MAFVGDSFVSDSGANTSAPRIFRYRNLSDTIADIKAANYFDPAATPAGYGLRDGDVILAEGSDGTSYLRMTVAAGAATVSRVVDFV